MHVQDSVENMQAYSKFEVTKKHYLYHHYLQFSHLSMQVTDFKILKKRGKRVVTPKINNKQED